MTLPEHIFAFDAACPLLFTQFTFWAFFAIVYAFFAILMEATNRRDNAPEHASHRRMHMRNIFLLFVSWFFYYKTSGLCLIILLFVTCSDWLIAHCIHGAQTKQRTILARFWLILSVAIDLGVLCYFKYAYFLTNLVNDLFATHFAVFDIFAYIGNGLDTAGRFSVDSIVLPVGISFYIFQVISYTSDVYHNRIQPVGNILDFGFYVSFFPQLVAGPIVRASEFIPQLYRPFRLSNRCAKLALFWILCGLTKKIIFSDYIALQYVDRVFANPLLFTGPENLFALFAYSLQVYADFSGYTDIAIGIALLMGFHLPKNFDSPYKSLNPQQFWRRWHMSLSRWLKTYVYIPLGGNRTISFCTIFFILLFAAIALILSDSWVVAVVLLGIGLIVLVVGFTCPAHRRQLASNLNSFITMLLGGLWHGASWNFVLWGAMNGIGMIIYKLWSRMSWHLRVVLLVLPTALLWLFHTRWTLPVLNIVRIWLTILCLGTLVRYLYHLIRGHHPFTHLATAWAIAQTFTFITFTRLFFRASSNLDPATANQQAWDTALKMIDRIGSKWDLSIIPDLAMQYSTIIVLFALGMLIHWLPTRTQQWIQVHFCLLPIGVLIPLTVLMIILIYQFISADLQPFIYFQF